MWKLIKKKLQPSAQNKNPKQELFIKTNIFHRLIYFSPLIGFICAFPGMQIIAHSVDWQIYILSLILVIIFAFNAEIHPIVHIKELHIIFFYAISGRSVFCYIQDIRYVEVKRNNILLHIQYGRTINSPYLTKNNLKKIIIYLEKHNLFIIFA